MYWKREKEEVQGNGDKLEQRGVKNEEKWGELEKRKGKMGKKRDGLEYRKRKVGRNGAYWKRDKEKV